MVINMENLLFLFCGGSRIGILKPKKNLNNPESKDIFWKSQVRLAIVLLGLVRLGLLRLYWFQ